MNDTKITTNSPTNTKITAGRQKKIEIVAKLNEKISTAKAIVFTNYQGLTHKQLEGLKKTIKPMQADYVVAKNSLVLRALGENKIKVDPPAGGKKQFEGPTGTLLIYDEAVGPLKALAKIIKELGIPSVKFGILDNKTFTGEQILKISSLPSREVLLTQVAIGLKSPIFGLHRALNWNLQKLVMTLNAIANSKPALAVASTPTPVATPEEKVDPDTIGVEIPAAEETPAEQPAEESKPEEETEEVKN